jgi:hypothetical protein
MTKRSNEQINVDEIPAGWGIDGLIAQRFLGWEKGSQVLAGPSPFMFWWHPPDGGQAVTLPPKLSEDLNLAMDVVEALFALGWKFGMTQNSDRQVIVMFIPKTEGEYNPAKAVKAWVPSVKLAALAICRAALLVANELYEEPTLEMPM